MCGFQTAATRRARRARPPRCARFRSSDVRRGARLPAVVRAKGEWCVVRCVGGRWLWMFRRFIGDLPLWRARCLQLLYVSSITADSQTGEIFRSKPVRKVRISIFVNNYKNRRTVRKLKSTIALSSHFLHTLLFTSLVIGSMSLLLRLNFSDYELPITYIKEFLVEILKYRS